MSVDTVAFAIVAFVAVYALLMGVWTRTRLRRVEKRLNMHGDSRDNPS